MAEMPTYVVLGRGRWAKRIRPIIGAEGRTVTTIEPTRQLPSDGTTAYLARLREAMKASRAQVAWLCVSPGAHVSLMIESALVAGLHVVVEKPWYGTAADTERLQALAHARRRLVAVHFEYLAHREVGDWKKRFYPGRELRFGGHFSLGRPDHTGIPALDNLGCHLMAIREFAAPASEICELACGYEGPEERAVWLERCGRRVASIDLRQGSGLIIQEFMKKVETALEAAAFPFDLGFAWRVANQLNAYKARCPG